MGKHKKYRIERRLRCCKDYQRGLCEYVSLTWAKGYLFCENEHYPSNDLRVVDMETNEVVIEQIGNGEVHLNKENH